MAEHVQTIEGLKQLPPNLHIFCPRNSEGDPDRYERPDQEKERQDAKSRRDKFYSALPLLAYDGEECKPFHNWLYGVMDTQLRSCELCIREYYVDKATFKAQLLQEYDDSEVEQFLDIITRRDLDRIKTGLDAARKTLESIPETKRTPAALDTSQLFALFEALHCEPFFSNDHLLRIHFDKPFKLVQTKRELKIADVLPAVTQFLFSAEQDRLSWAVRTWQRFDRNPSDIEWDWSIKDTLVKELNEITNEQGLIRYWSGLRIIIEKLSEEQVRHKLFALGFNFSRLTLDHLAKKTMAIPQITQALTQVFRKAPDAYWQALMDVSASTVAEVVFGSKNFDRCLEAQIGPQNKNGSLDVLSWLDPFIEGLQPANRPAAARTVVDQLIDRVKSQELSEDVKKLCMETAIHILTTAVLSFSIDERARKTTARPILSDVLTIIGSRLDFVLSQKASTADKEKALRERVATLVRNALALETRILRDDFEAISAGKPVAQNSSYTPQMWSAATQALNAGDSDYSASLLKATMDLAGLEKFIIKTNTEYSKQKQSFNEIYGKLEKVQCGIAETLADFPPTHLDDLFNSQDSNMALIAFLFSGHDDTYQATTELIKNVSGASARREGLFHLLDAFLPTTCFSVCWVFRRVANTLAFAPIPRLLQIGKDIMQILCDSSGLLRGRDVKPREAHAVQSYWTYSWLVLGVIFRRMEKWSIEVHDKALMTTVCRDTMQYAQELFSHYYLFVKVASQGKSEEEAASVPKILLNTDRSSTSGSPPKTLDAMVKWLRLRDAYLAETLVDLIVNMLNRLKEYGTRIPDDSTALTYVEQVALAGPKDKGLRTNLTDQQKAALVRVLENYTGRQIAPKSQAVKKQQRLDQWTDPNAPKTESRKVKQEVITIDDDDFDDVDLTFEDLVALEKEATKQDFKISDTSKAKLQARATATAKQLPSRPQPKGLSLQERAAKQAQNSKAFIEKRKAEMAAKKERDRQLAAKLRGRTEMTANAGSGLAGIGVEGKDHSAARSDLMVSSSSESESSEDEELFGKSIKVATVGKTVSKQTMAQGPVRKIKQVRSAKDMRARLAPDLTGLHKTILGWDFFADTDTPPNSDRDDYTLVTNTFKTVQEYQKTFEPLLVLEGWQSFRSAREDGNFKTFEIKIASSLIVDNFFEVNTVIPITEGRDLGLSASDVVLLSKDDRPHLAPNSPHCLARVKEVTRKRGEMQIVYRVNSANNPMRQNLNDKATVYGVQILSLTPLEREYGALMALPYYDLSEEIIKAKPSPLLEYKDAELRDIKEIYNVNTAQAKAVKSAVDNDAFTLVQGPPGSGKTKTICAIVGAIMTNSLSRGRAQTNGNAATSVEKKVLVCAPSNAAVDELVMRFKNGIKLMNGSSEVLNVVRLGRSDAINVAVKDVTLEELVNAKLGEDGSSVVNNREDIHTIMMDHKKASEELVQLRNKVTEERTKGQTTSPQDEQLMDSLRRRKTALGTKIDEMREKQNSASRDADINRRRIQQQILDQAHVICATLSGSGHEIFQGLNVEFETVIIDEAAQSIELSALIPLKYGCSKCILVGDPKQLPPTVLSRQAAKFQYEQSLFARMEGNHQKDVHLLDIQYRMHPEISAWPSKTFYDSKLRDGGDMAQLRARVWHRSQIFSPYRFFDVQGMSESAPKGRSLVNHAEIEVAIQMYDRLISDVPKYNFKGKIGIITPYKGQLNALKQKFTYKYGQNITSDIEFNTTDAFQGRESEIIIFSCVRASTQGIGFLQDVRRMNVGLTRAKCSLWVLGNSQALVQGEFWRALVDDAKKRSLYTDGNILQILRRPLLTEDMMRDDVEMNGLDEETSAEREPAIKSKNQDVSEPTLKSVTADSGLVHTSVSTSTRPGSDASISRNKPDTNSRTNSSASISHYSSPGERTSSTLTSSHGKKQNREDRVLEAPLQRQNPAIKPNEISKSRCSICGALKHGKQECHHDLTQEGQRKKCNKCKRTGHDPENCPAPQCLACGKIGHVEKECKDKVNKRMNEKDEEHLQREAAYQRAHMETGRNRNGTSVSDGGTTIPVVKSTAPEKSLATSEKRKRDSIADNAPQKSARKEQNATNSPRPQHGQQIRSKQVVKRRKPQEADMFISK